MKRRSEKRLVSRIVAGDAEAAAQLVRLHWRSITRFLIHLCKDQDAAQDLAQETFVSCWLGISTFKSRSSLAAWLHRIAYHKFVDWLRQTHRPGGNTASTSIAEQTPSRAQDPLAKTLEDEQSRVLYQAVHKLDEGDRALIALHYLQDLSFRQMAVVLDEPVGTVKWRTNRALRHLRALLSDGR